MAKKNGIRPNPGQVKETFTVPGRTNYYMPIWQTFDAAAGTIHIAKRYRMIPRDRLETNLQAVINTLPALAPAMSRYKARIYAFWIPDRLYVPELRINNNGYSYGGVLDEVDDFTDAKYPVLQFDQGTPDYIIGIGQQSINPFSGALYKVGINSILHNIGFSNNSFAKFQDFNDRAYLGIDMLAYYDIFRNYFANANEENYFCYKPSVVYDSSASTLGDVDFKNYSGLYSVPLADLNDYYKYQYWLNDGFSRNGNDEYKPRQVVWNYLDDKRTSNVVGLDLPFSMPTIQYDIEGNEFIRLLPYSWSSSYEYAYRGSNGYSLYSSTPLAGLVTKTYMADLFSTGISSSQYSNIIQNSLVAINNGALNMNDLLAGERLYEYFTKKAATGMRYDEFIRAEYGVDIRKYLDIPTFIKSWSFDVGFAHVTATTSASGGQQLGSLAGRGVGKLNDDTRFNFSADEYGSLMFLFTIEPYVSYGDMIDPFLLDTEYTDLFSPSFDRMGLEPMVDGVPMANPIGAGLDSTLFYQPSWIKYKTDVSRSFGELSASLDYWLVNRVFATETGDIDLTDNAFSTYIKPFQVVPMFNVLDYYPCPFIVQIGFDTTIKRPISANSFDTF